MATVNLIVLARCPETCYPYEARGMDSHSLLPPYSQNYYTYSNVVQIHLVDIMVMHGSKFQEEIPNICWATEV